MKTGILEMKTRGLEMKTGWNPRWSQLFGAALAGAFLGGSALVSPATSEAREFEGFDPAVERATQQEQQDRALERRALEADFREAYRRFPDLPEGILEAVAFAGSRWLHRVPEAPQAGHHNMPQTYGVMGLYRGAGGFRDVVQEAADALGVPAEDVIASPRENVLATAALLDLYRRQEGLAHPDLEQLVPALRRLSGLPGRGRVGRFAQDSFAYDVLLTLDRGHDDWGIRIQDREVLWELAFDAETLKLLRAPMVRVGAEDDSVEALQEVRSGLSLERPSPAGSSPDAERTEPESTDYPPALWVSSPNYSSRSGSAITNIAIHTVQGSYSGCISWFQNPDSDVSAHYVVRSSDGQVTQMVREYNKAWHIGSANPYTLGTEHEGYVDTSSYYTTAMYNSSSALSKDMCSSNKIDCTTCYPGPSSSSVDVKSDSYRVKGHQHYSNQTHTDPGKYWDWSRYKSLLGGSSGGSGGSGDSGGSSSSQVLDSFESSEGHFNTSPTYSGSTTGISTSSTAERSTGTRKNGSYSERLMLLDNTSSSSSWSVRFLSGTGSPSSNVKLDKAGGRIGFWVYSGGSGMTSAVTIDDGSGTEMSVKKSIPTTTWTYLEWKLDDAAQWDPWYNSNGTIDSSQVTLDAIWFFRAQTSYTVYVYIDDVTYKK